MEPPHSTSRRRRFRRRGLASQRADAPRRSRRTGRRHRKEGRGWATAWADSGQTTPEDRAALMQARVTGRLAEAKALLKLTPIRKSSGRRLKARFACGWRHAAHDGEEMKAREASRLIRSSACSSPPRPHV